MVHTRTAKATTPEAAAKAETPAVGPSPSPAPVDRMLTAQRTVGNQAVLRSDRAGTSSADTPAPQTRLPLGHGGGQSLPSAPRALMESRFGEDFGQVRVHADTSAAHAARALHAAAFTTGRDIYFGRGHYQPESPGGQRLLAHELTHVVQQRRSGPPPAAGTASHYTVSHPHAQDEREADRVAARVASGRAAPPIAATVPQQLVGGVRIARLQRQEEFATTPATVPGGGVTPGAGEGVDVMFIVPTAKFTPDIARYAEAVLVPDDVWEVQSVEDIFHYLTIYADNDMKVRRIRIVTHGTPAGNVTLRLKGQERKDRVTPKEIEAVARRPATRALIKRVMAPGALVEFWGCNVGLSKQAVGAWANLFQSTFKAPKGRFITEFQRFRRPARPKEKGTTIPGRPGRWVVMTHSSELDRSSPFFKEFMWWLVELYEDLVRNGDLAPVDDTGTPEERVLRRIAYMTRLFDASSGDIRNIAVERKDKTGVHPVRPGDREGWKDIWAIKDPVPLEAVADGKATVPPEPPPLPTDIEVKEPSDPSAFLGPSAPRPAPVGPQTPPSERPAGAAPECRMPDSDPTGSIFERVHFASDHADATRGAGELARFIALLGPNVRTGAIRVDGYASTDGDEDYNLRLSCRRAQSVRDQLIRLGVPSSHITTYAHGETTQFSAKNRPENRVAIVSASLPSVPEHGAVTPVEPVPREEKAPAQHPRDEPHLLLRGKDAAAAVARILPTARPITLSTSMGYVRLVPGTVWDNQKMLVYASDWIVYYTVGHNLYESSPSTFLRSFWFDALAKGAESASHWSTVAKVEFALLEGIFVPWYLLLGVSVAGALLSYRAHKEQIDAALRQVPRVLRLLQDFHARYPRLFNKIAWSVAKEVFVDLPKGIEAEDIAFFIGRLFHRDWIRGFTEGGLLVETLTIKKFIAVVASTAGLVAVTHLPKIAVRGVEAAIDQRVDAWRTAMAAEGVTMSEEEARVLFRELAAHPDSAQRLKVLQAALQDVLPALEALAKSVRMY